MTKSEPSTMEELLAQTGYEPHVLKKGQQVTGVVTSISPKEILLDVNAKTEGIVLEKDRKLLRELLATLHLGDKVNAVVISPESEHGHPVLSLRKELMDKNWDMLLSKKEKGEEIEATGVELTRGGLLVETLGLRGFIPLSHLDIASGERPEGLVGSSLKVKVLDLDRKERRIVLSQKGTRFDSRKLKAILDKLEIGKEYDGTVSGITNFGVFVKLTFEKEEIEGLVHISEISWEKVEDISKLFRIGDKVHVLVIGLDKENLKLNLSLKKLTEDPWEKVAALYAKEQQVTGRVSKVSPFGVFVTLSDGVEGLIHKSKIPLDGEFKVGDKVTCIVESVDPPKRRIALAPLLKEKPVGYR